MSPKGTFNVKNNLFKRMKKTTKLFLAGLYTLAMTLSAQPVQAQGDLEFGLFDHLGAGLSLGTDGIGIDVATPLTDWAAVRAGFTFLPQFKVKVKDIHIKDDDPSLEDHVDVEIKPSVFDAKVLADFYPFKGSSFHLTAGAYFGKSEFATITNTSMFIKDPAKYGKLGLVLGDYRLTTDERGYVDIDVKVNSFKPYVGFGFGRAVPKKSRVSVSCDIGVKFWGKPSIGAMTEDDWGEKTYHKFKSSDLDDDDDEDVKDALKITEKVIGYPVIKVRISGRIF